MKTYIAKTSKYERFISSAELRAGRFHRFATIDDQSVAQY